MTDKTVSVPQLMSDWFTAPESQQHVSPEEVIASAIREHKPARIFACFSSGNDSIVATHIAMKNGAHEVFNINTTIGIPAARRHLYEVCDRFNWPLRVKVPEMDYETLVMCFGFPGPGGGHRYAYNRLKERAIRELVRETKREESDRIILVTGIRKTESVQRMGYVRPVQRLGSTVWVAPIFDWTTSERDAYMDEHDLPFSPVSEVLGISGECLCGAFARAGERKKVAHHFPEMDERLIRLEGKAKSAGMAYCEWGNGRRVDPNQEEIFMAMCADCH